MRCWRPTCWPTARRPPPFTYLGEKITHDIYWNGSIGAAKKDLDQKVLGIRDKLAPLGGDARVSVLRRW